MKGVLILENGQKFYGNMLMDEPAVGEVVFNTGMTGYQETFTDPSYAGQIITMTYPLIGNYGLFHEIEQADRPYAAGFIVSELCEEPSNWQNEGKLSTFIMTHHIPCLYGVDTRAITRAIRSQGVMKGVIVPETMEESAIKELFDTPLETQLVRRVTTREIKHMGDGRFHVAVMDYGAKANILRELVNSDCRLTIFPAETKAEEVLAVNPDGIFLSNGPGDPKDVPYIVEEVKKMNATVNEMLGDIVKVTPSSKAVGDMAIFMVQNNLTPDNIIEKGKNIDFPDSIVSYFQGMMGQPEGGFPEDLQKIVLKDKEPLTCRPGELLPDEDLDADAEYLKKEYGIVRYEWESFGYDMALPPGKNSLHLPFYQTNTSQYCTLYAKCMTGERGKQKLAEECPKFCKDYAFLYPDHLMMIGRYNSLFALDSRIFEDGSGSGTGTEIGTKIKTEEILKKWKKAGMDRLVVNLLDPGVKR